MSYPETIREKVKAMRKHKHDTPGFCFQCNKTVGPDETDLEGWIFIPTEPGPWPTIQTEQDATDWTSQTAYDIYRNNDGGFKAIADARNASLAAEHKKFLAEQSEANDLSEMVDDLRTQLAAAQTAMDLADKHEVELIDAAVAEATKSLVELFGQVLSETVDAPVYPDGPCLNKETRNDIKALLAQHKEKP